MRFPVSFDCLAEIGFGCGIPRFVPPLSSSRLLRYLYDGFPLRNEPGRRGSDTLLRRVHTCSSRGRICGPSMIRNEQKDLSMQEELRQRKQEVNAPANDGREADELDSVEQPVSTPGFSCCYASPSRKGKEKDIDSDESRLWLCDLLRLPLYYLSRSLSNTHTHRTDPGMCSCSPCYVVWLVLRTPQRPLRGSRGKGNPAL